MSGDSTLEIQKPKSLVRVYITSAVSFLNEKERGRMAALKLVISDALRAKGNVEIAHCIGEFTPNDDRAVIDHDIRCVGHCNLLIILGDYPSKGIGVEFTVANLSRKKVLELLSGEAQTTSHFTRGGLELNKHYELFWYQNNDHAARIATEALDRVRAELAGMFS